MTKTEERKLKTALRRLEKCGGDCHHCEKCRVYTRSTERALYMAICVSFGKTGFYKGVQS